MKSSGIGGQAVIEGVMMKNKDKYAIAVRKPDNTIEVQCNEFKSVINNKNISNTPIIRGVFNFIDSMVLGMKSLSFSASFFEDDDEEPSKADKLIQKVFKDKADKFFMSAAICFSIVLAIAIFMVLPYYISSLFRDFFLSDMAIAVLEGAIRLIIFIAYISLISLMKDIQRVYMYHGAEHKCINCIEHGLELNVENVRNSSKQHKRCGTSFMLLVIVISIILFLFIRVDSPALRVAVRIALVPVIAGISYEFIRLAGRSDNIIINIISKPGMWLQNLTTREPDDEMIEVAIASVEAVFDWKTYIDEETEHETVAQG